jgi:hypothetical protein
MRERLCGIPISVVIFFLTLGYWNHVNADPIRVGLVYDTGGGVVIYLFVTPPMPVRQKPPISGKLSLKRLLPDKAPTLSGF